MPSEAVTYRGHRYRVDKLPDDRFRWRAVSGGWISQGSDLCQYWVQWNELLSDEERTCPTPEEANRLAEEAIERHILQDERPVGA